MVQKTKILMAVLCLGFCSTTCLAQTFTSFAENCNSCNSTNANCEQRPGYVVCSCKNGFAGNGLNCTKMALCSRFRCCPDGYEWENGKKSCVDIDECADPALNKCSPTDTCINKNGIFLCAKGKKPVCPTSACASDLDCLSISGKVQCADPCTNYQEINGESRLANMSSAGRFRSDRYGFGWFRYTGRVGVNIAEGCVGSMKCGSLEPLSLGDSHPSIGEGVKMVPLIINSVIGCLPGSTLPVKACPEGFYVYKFSGMLKYDVYCTDPVVKNPVTTTTVPTTTTPTTTSTTENAAGPSTTTTTETAAGPSTTSTTETAAGPSTTSTTETAAKPSTTTTETAAGPSTTSTTETAAGPSTTSTTETAAKPSTTTTESTAGPSTTTTETAAGPSTITTESTAGPSTTTTTEATAGPTTTTTTETAAEPSTTTTETAAEPSTTTTETAAGPSTITTETAAGPSTITTESTAGPSTTTTTEATAGPTTTTTTETAAGPARTTTDTAAGPSRTTTETAAGPSTTSTTETAAELTTIAALPLDVTTAGPVASGFGEHMSDTTSGLSDVVKILKAVVTTDEGLPDTRTNSPTKPTSALKTIMSIITTTTAAPITRNPTTPRASIASENPSSTNTADSAGELSGPTDDGIPTLSETQSETTFTATDTQPTISETTPSTDAFSNTLNPESADTTPSATASETEAIPREASTTSEIPHESPNMSTISDSSSSEESGSGDDFLYTVYPEVTFTPTSSNNSEVTGIPSEAKPSTAASTGSPHPTDTKTSSIEGSGSGDDFLYPVNPEATFTPTSSNNSEVTGIPSEASTSTTASTGSPHPTDTKTSSVEGSGSGDDFLYPVNPEATFTPTSSNNSEVTGIPSEASTSTTASTGSPHPTDTKTSSVEGSGSGDDFLYPVNPEVTFTPTSSNNSEVTRNPSEASTSTAASTGSPHPTDTETSSVEGSGSGDALFDLVNTEGTITAIPSEVIEGSSPDD